MLNVGRDEQEMGLRNNFIGRISETEGIYEKIYNLVSNENNDITQRALRLCKRICPENKFDYMDLSP